MRISDWSSDVCSSDLPAPAGGRSAALLHLGLIAGPVLVVDRIEAGQLRAVLHLLHDPALQTLLLETELGDLLDEGLRHHHGAVPVGDDEVVGADRDATAGDRLLPADEGEAGHRAWCGEAAGPYRHAAPPDAAAVAPHAGGPQRAAAPLAPLSAPS